MRKLFTLLISCMLFLTLHAQINVFPWTESFEGSSSFPAGWTQEYENLNYSWTVNSTATHAHTGTHHAYFWAQSHDFPVTYLITPSIDLTGMANISLSFYYYCKFWDPDIDTLGIYYRPASGGDWVYIGSYNQYTTGPYGSTIPNWILLTFSLDNVDNSTPIQIGFRAWGDYGYGIGIDDITIDGIPTSGCIRPSGLTAFNITANSAEISFTVGDASDTLWYAYYKSTSSSTWDSIRVTTNPFSIASLQPASTYQVYMKTVCDDIEFSSPSATITFRTLCAPITVLPIIENFEGYGTGEAVMPACWTRITTSTANRPYVNSSGVTGNCLYFYAGLPGYNLAIMPPLDEAIDISNLMISFAYKGLYVYDTLRIGVMTDVANANTFEEIAFVTGTASWRNFEVLLSSYTGTGQFIAFKVNYSHQSYGYLDNLVVDIIPACPNPQDFTAIQNTPTSVHLNWTEEPGIVSRILEYKKASESTWNAAPNVTAPPYILTDLDAENEYHFRLKLGCGGTDESNYKFTDVYIGYYCIPTFVYNTYTWYYTNSFVTTGSSITNLQDNTTCTPVTYNDRTSLPFEAEPGDVLNFTASYAGGTHGIAIWVDLNQNYTFEETERVYNTTSYQYTPHSGTIAIPTDIPSGTYQVRVQIDGSNNNPTDPCQNYSGNIIDYALTITIPSCPRPANLTVENITTTDATVNWVQGSDETEWLFSYKLSSGTNWFSETHITSLLPVYLNDLDANSLYDVRVRSVCGEGDTSLYSSASFRTLCSSITTLPIIENFEGYGTGEAVMPTCWTRITTSTANRPYIYSGGGVTGNCLYFYAGLPGYNLAIMPPLDEAIDISNLMISFAYKGLYTYDTLRIGVMTDVVNGNSFEEVAFVTGTSSWRDFEVFLSSYTGTGRFIAFKVNYSHLSYGYLDNLEINTAPVCDGPVNMQISITANNMIEVTWEGGPDDIGWRYQLTNLTGGEEFPEEPRTLEEGPNYIFSGLTEGHEYQLCVKSECRAGLLSAEVCTTFRAPTSEYTITVTREPVNGGTVTPPGPVTLAPESAQSFTITPNANFTIEEVLLDGNTVSLTTGDTTGGVYSISNIRQNHLLHVRFKDHTGVDENNLSKEVTLYPNPAQNAIYIETQSLYKKVEIINVIGEVIYSENIENMKFDLDISSYASGLYLVRLYGDRGMATKKFVKE